MKSEVRGSILAFTSEKRGKKGGIAQVQELVKLTHFENTQEGTMRTMRPMRSLHTEFGTEQSEVKLGYSRVSSGFLTYSPEEINQV